MISNLNLTGLLICWTALFSLENMGFVANMVSLFMYFLYVMYFNLAGAANTLTNMMGATFLLSLIGGFVSDTSLTRLNTGLIFGTIELLVKTRLCTSELIYSI